MKINIRQEQKADYKQVAKLIKSAFEASDLGHNEEQDLVDRLRKSDSFIPELSLIAAVENKIVGHILFSEIKIKNRTIENIPR